MQTIQVPLPQSVEPYRHELEDFFRLMVRKLHANRHKGFTKNMDVRVLLGLLRIEVAELQGAGSQIEAVGEAADIANFALLLAITFWDMTRTDFDTVKEGD